MNQVTDPKTGKVWQLKGLKNIKDVYADVYARWVFNCVVPEAKLKELIGIDYLEPQLVRGKGVLSLCAIFMRHAAPSWMPLNLGPGLQSCALRIACIDKRDGSPAVWVGTRYTDSFLAPVLAFLGFPSVNNDLRVTEDDEKLDFETKDKTLECRFEKVKEKTQSVLFEKDTDFDDYFCAGVRSYSPSNDRTDIIDLHKLKDNKFQKKNMQGFLNTEFGCWPIESAYLTENGLYKWTCEGRC